MTILIKVPKLILRKYEQIDQYIKRNSDNIDWKIIQFKTFFDKKNKIRYITFPFKKINKDISCV